MDNGGCAECERLGEIIGEAYQVVASLAYYAGWSDHPDVIRALDKLAWYEDKYPSLLPWPKEDLPPPTGHGTGRRPLEEGERE